MQRYINAAALFMAAGWIGLCIYFGWVEDRNWLAIATLSLFAGIGWMFTP